MAEKLKALERCHSQSCASGECRDRPLSPSSDFATDRVGISPAAILNPGDQRLAIALLSSIDERAEHGLDHGFDGRIIDALGLRQLGRDGFEVAIACRWRQRHRTRSPVSGSRRPDSH